jgi:hypothetical protein
MHSVPLKKIILTFFYISEKKKNYRDLDEVIIELKLMKIN